MKYLVILLMFSFASLNAQTEIDQKELNQQMDEVMKEMQKAMDTLDLEKLFEQSFGMFQDEESMDQIKGMMDSLDMNQLFGGDFSKMFGENGIQMEGFEMGDLNKMMEESMKMFENMDPKMMEDMMRGFDFQELEKMFEGLDMEQFKQMAPNKPAEKKGLKKA